MGSNHHRCFSVADRSYLALIKKDIHHLAQTCGFSTQRLAETDIIVAELASNLVKYAKDGQLLVKVITETDRSGLELISVDQGPGITDISRMMEDGVSTSSTLGSGLGAIKRLADQFEVQTIRGWGSIILVRIWTKATSQTRKYTAEVKGIVVPKPGETDCGDAMSVKQTPQKLSVFLGDGLGHGPEASHAAQKAVKAFEECTEESPAELLRYIHQSVKKTRGLVATIATFDFQQRLWRICGIGNIACRLGNADQIKTCLPYNGIVGMNIPSSINDQEISWHQDQLLILCSDGLKSRFDLYRNNGIYKQDLSILATALYKDYARQTDDMSVVTGKLNI